MIIPNAINSESTNARSAIQALEDFQNAMRGEAEKAGLTSNEAILEISKEARLKAHAEP